MKTLRQIVFLLLSLTVITFGVAFSIRGNLGVSPISSIPNVLSQFTPLTVGNGSIIVNGSLIFFQIAVLGKEFKLRQLLQIPVIVVFGYIQDFAIWATRGIGYTNYMQQWMLCLFGILLLGIGVAGELAVAVIAMPAEALNLAICSKYPVKQGNVKIAIDSSLVAIAAVISLVFMHRLAGIREGTVAGAFLVGTVVKLVFPTIQSIMRRFTGADDAKAANG